MVTVKQLQDILKNEYDDDAIAINIYNKLLAIMQKYEGKPVSKRIMNDFLKANPEYSAYWDDNYGMYHIDIYEGDSKRTFNNKLQFRIGSKGFSNKYAPDVDLNRYVEQNAWANRGAIERNQERTNLLNDDLKLATIAKALNDYQDAHDRLTTLLDYPLPDRYSFAKLVNFKS